MAKETLNAVTALGEYECHLDGFKMTETADVQLLSIGFTPSDSARVGDMLSSTLSLALPAVGFRTVSADSNGTASDVVERTLLGLQRDQLWLLSSSSDDKTSLSSLNSMDAPIWTTDQSDAWTMLNIAGSRCISVLERLCPLDLHPNRFTDTSVARTAFEHMSAVILRRNAELFQLLTPRSSVQSFVHAVSHAANHVVNESAVRV